MSDARERADRLVREWAGADWSPIYARLKELIEHEIVDVLAHADTLATELTEQLRAAQKEIADLNDAVAELDRLREDIDEHLPEYALDDGTGDPANASERIEYAGAELKRIAAAYDAADEMTAAVRMAEAEVAALKEEIARLHAAAARRDS